MSEVSHAQESSTNHDKLQVQGESPKGKPVDAASISKIVDAVKTDPDRAMHDLAGVPQKVKTAEQNYGRYMQTRTEKPEISDAQRQQDKIIAAFVSTKDVQDAQDRQGIYRSVLGQQRVNLGPQDREAYMQMVRDGRIKSEDYKNLFDTIRKSNDNPQALDQRLQGMDKQMRGIIAHFATGRLNERSTLTADNLKDFTKDLSVFTFDNAQEKFLSTIEQHNGPQKRAEYMQAFDRVGQSMFGKQWEYLKQVKALESQAGPKVKETMSKKSESQSSRPEQQLQQSARRGQAAIPQQRVEQPVVSAPVIKEQPKPEPAQADTRSFWQKTKDRLSKVGENAQLSAIMVAQAGGIHPARVDGAWQWVVEPWAKIDNDPKDNGWRYQEENVYDKRFRELKAQGVSTVDSRHLPQGLPALRPQGLRLQYLDHNRIKAARGNKMKIAVTFHKVNSFN